MTTICPLGCTERTARRVHVPGRAAPRALQTAQGIAWATHASPDEDVLVCAHGDVIGTGGCIHPPN